MGAHSHPRTDHGLRKCRRAPWQQRGVEHPGCKMRIGPHNAALTAQSNQHGFCFCSKKKDQGIVILFRVRETQLPSSGGTSLQSMSTQKRDTTDHGNSGAREHHNTVNETTRLPSGNSGMRNHLQMTCTTSHRSTTNLQLRTGMRTTRKLRH